MTPQDATSFDSDATPNTVVGDTVAVRAASAKPYVRTSAIVPCSTSMTAAPGTSYSASNFGTVVSSVAR
jgi:hypothetical protein